MTKKFSRLSVLILLILLVICTNSTKVFASDIETPAQAKAMVVLEGKTNTVLYSFNKDIQLPEASTTKIVTCILAIENCDDLDKKFKISDKAVGIEGTSIYIKSGEMLSMRELLYGLMLASGNDCAMAIAEYFDSSENFVQMMNDFATSLGLTNTHFDNPHGLDSDNHFTSAYDLAIMTSYALKNETFREIVATERMVIDGNETSQARYLKNKNKLMFKYENCIGVKTGFTDNAGRCLVNAHEEDNMQIVSVVLNCGPMFEECERMTNLALKQYCMKEFVKPYSFVSNISIDDSDKDEIGVITVKGFLLPVLKENAEMYQVKYDLPDSMTAPITLNQNIGKVQVLFRDEVIFEDGLITIEGADNNDLKYLFDNIIDKWF